MLGKFGRAWFDYKKIGRGKDGVVFRLTVFGFKIIIKKLSAYGKIWNANSKFVAKILPASDYFSKLFIIGNCHVYRDRQSYSWLFAKETIPFFISEIATLEKMLLAKDFLYWDFGYSAPNYLCGKTGFFLIDYGGNAWIFLTPHSRIDLNISKDRGLIFNPNSTFVAAILMLHICKFYLKVDTFEKISTQSVQNDIIYCRKIIAKAQEIFSYFGLTGLGELIAQSNLLTAQGWQNLIDYVKVPAEKADIKKITLGLFQTKILGYQNYKLKKNGVVLPFNQGHKWANSQVKLNFVKEILIDNKYWCHSFMDIGANLGMYVFFAASLGYVSCGFDYNPIYTAICRTIAQKNNIRKANFFCQKFSAIKSQADVVFLGALIHHLYKRTENFNSLDLIMKTLAGLTEKIAIVEFPSEKDCKAKKWTEADGSYCRVAFWEAASKCFSQVVKIGEIKENNIERVFYLLSK